MRPPVRGLGADCRHQVWASRAECMCRQTVAGGWDSRRSEAPCEPLHPERHSVSDFGSANPVTNSPWQTAPALSVARRSGSSMSSTRRIGWRVAPQSARPNDVAEACMRSLNQPTRGDQALHGTTLRLHRRAPRCSGPRKPIRIGLARTLTSSTRALWRHIHRLGLEARGNARGRRRCR